MEVSYNGKTRKTKFEVGDDVWIVNGNTLDGISIDCESVLTISVLVGNQFIANDSIDIEYNLTRHKVNDKYVGEMLFATREEAKAKVLELIDKKKGCKEIIDDLGKGFMNAVDKAFSKNIKKGKKGNKNGTKHKNKV